jgi:cytochrome P450
VDSFVGGLTGKAGFVALKCLYNIYLHPLRSYPGPLLARASILTYQRHLLRGRAHLWVQDQHKQYGPVVRLSPNELSFIEPEVWKDVYGHRASAFTKSYSFYGHDVHGNPPGILRADNAGHARQRKTVSHAFSDRALKDQEELLKDYTSLLVEKLQGVAAGQLRTDIVKWCTS